MDSGVPGLECKAHGRATSENDRKGGVAMKNGPIHRNTVQTAYFLSAFNTRWIPVGSSPTGCQGFADNCLLALLYVAFYLVIVRQLTIYAPRLPIPHSVTLVQLRFTCVSPGPTYDGTLAKPQVSTRRNAPMLGAQYAAYFASNSRPLTPA